MLTKEDKTLIKNVWESKKYGAKRLIKEFPNKKWSKRMVLRTFRSDCEQQRGPLIEYPVVDVRARRALLRTLTLWGPGTEPGKSTPDTPLRSTDLTRARNTSNK